MTMNKTRRGLALAATLLVLATGNAGCTERAAVTLHEPGVYKGSTDPLLAKLEDQQLSDALQERLVKGQSDR